MSTHCQVTGKSVSFGKNVSHSHRRTSRTFRPNLQKKTYFVPSLGRKITITVSTRGIKEIDKRGIDAVAAEMLARGEKF